MTWKVFGEKNLRTLKIIQSFDSFLSFDSSCSLSAIELQKRDKPEMLVMADAIRRVPTCCTEMLMVVNAPLPPLILEGELDTIIIKSQGKCQRRSFSADIHGHQILTEGWEIEERRHDCLYSCKGYHCFLPSIPIDFPL